MLVDRKSQKRKKEGWVILPFHSSLKEMHKTFPWAHRDLKKKKKTVLKCIKQLCLQWSQVTDYKEQELATKETSTYDCHQLKSPFRSDGSRF